MPGDLPYRIGWRTSVVRWLCLLSAASYLVAVWLAYSAPASGELFDLVFRARGEVQLDNNPIVLALLAILAWASVNLALLIALMVWMHAAVSNAQALDPNGNRIGPWMAVIWWIIPIFNFVQPLRVMSQTYNTSVDRNPDINGPAAPTVVAWWLLAAVGSFASFAALGSLMSSSPGEILDHAGAVGFGTVTWLGALGSLSNAVKQIGRAQIASTQDAAPGDAQPA